MSILSDRLPQQVVQKWRNFASDGAFRFGIDWLRHNSAPKIRRGVDIADKLEDATSWTAYMSALQDVEDVLTTPQSDASSLDEPSIHDDAPLPPPRPKTKP